MTGAAMGVVVGGGAGSSGAVGITFNTPSVRGANSGTAGTVSIVTQPVTGTASGGVGPYTYQWTQTVFGTYTWAINAPTANTTGFTCQSMLDGTSDYATFNLKVTDSTGAIANKTVNASANNKDTLYAPTGTGARP